MKTDKTKKLTRVVIVLALVAAATGAPARGQQGPRGEARREQIELGRGMSMVAPSLIEIAVRTNLFLLLADRVQMTEGQKTKLEEVMFDFQRFAVQKQADYDVADAELMRLLTRDTVDMTAVRAKVKEIEALNADLNIRKYETVLKAIGVLTHEQHLKIVALARTLPREKQPEPERVF
jgi:hypothetical protein